jgi:glycosyltransferase involved in cell wall biosynthesis
MSPSDHDVWHFGPGVDHPGGMASVIRTLVRHRVAARRAESVATWDPRSHLRSALLVSGAVRLVFRLPRGSVVHVHMSQRGSFIRETAVLAAAACRRLTRVVSIHGPDFESFASSHPYLAGLACRLATAVTVLTPGDLAAVQRVGHGVHVELVPNPVVTEMDADLPQETEEVVLFAGEVGLRKGVDVLMKAWRDVLIERPTAKLLIAGPPTDFVVPELPRMTLLGPLSSEQVRRLMIKARVVALPSRAEALPMTLLEAMSVGRPFVATPVGSVPQLGAGGILVEVGDHVATATALMRLLMDAELAERTGAAGKEFVAERMSLASVEEAFLELYDGRS